MKFAPHRILGFALAAAIALGLPAVAAESASALTMYPPVVHR